MQIMKTLRVFAVASLITCALLATLTACNWAWRYYTAPVSGKVNAEEQIESAPSRIGNYEHFYDLCASVQGYEGALSAQRDQLKGADAEDASRIRSNIAGIQGQRRRAIAQYNADARKSYTRARFLGSDLPSHINPNQEQTQCAL